MQPPQYQFPASFNTQPPEGGCSHPLDNPVSLYVSTHSRPKAAAATPPLAAPRSVGFNTQPPEGVCVRSPVMIRLCDPVSTHSRPKAAAVPRWPESAAKQSFNTQPPEGGCAMRAFFVIGASCFNTQPPEGGCLTGGRSHAMQTVSTHSRPKAAAGSDSYGPMGPIRFQHTAARRRLLPA